MKFNGNGCLNEWWKIINTVTFCKFGIRVCCFDHLLLARIKKIFESNVQSLIAIPKERRQAFLSVKISYAHSICTEHTKQRGGNALLLENL